MVTLKVVVEALLFSSQKPLTAKEILQVVRLGMEYASEEELESFKGTTEAMIQNALVELSGEYQQLERAFQLVEQVAGWQLTTKPEHQTWVRQLFPELRPARLSPPALETLAIVAYRQPVTKADIEAIRGVAVDGVIQRLLDVGMLKIAGRAEIPGRPLLYETTQHFLEHFGIKNLDELPNASELRYVPLPNGSTGPTDEPESSELFKESPKEELPKAESAKEESASEESPNPESPREEPPQQQTAELPPENVPPKLVTESGAPIDEGAKQE
jgi:segregation and condensation protein B